MKEAIETIPVNEAFDSGDECPFCYLERLAEQRAIRFTLGPCVSYMEPAVREATTKAGFCGPHLKKAFDYGNALGNGLILQSYMNTLIAELHSHVKTYEKPPKRSLFKKPEPSRSSLLDWLKAKQSTCFICEKVETNMRRYYSTFFVLIKEPEFRQKAENCKGFCLRHFTRLLETAPKELPNSQYEWFYPTALSLMENNLARVKGDVDWFVDMYDFRNTGRDWKNSRDAVSRTMQKLRGIYPADPPYRQK